MPELPEVEHAVRRLRRHVRGERIARIDALHPAQARLLDAAARRRAKARAIVDVVRRGKHQVLQLDNGGAIVAHFRMDGDWSLDHAEDPLPRFARVVMHFESGKRAVLVDGRALSTVEVARPGEDLLPPLGVDASDPGLSADILRDALARRGAPIKPVLLDQSVIAGLGNIYAAEALWHARIDPRAAAKSLSRDRVSRLVDGIREALARGTRANARYRSVESTGDLAVYGREGEACLRCGRPVRRITQAARSTYFCAACQR